MSDTQKTKRRWGGERQWQKVLGVLQKAQAAGESYAPLAAFRAIPGFERITRPLRGYIWAIKKHTGLDVASIADPSNGRKVIGYRLLQRNPPIEVTPAVHVFEEKV